MKLIDNIYNLLLFKYYHVIVGKKIKCIGRLIVQGHGYYKIGNNVSIISNPLVNPIFGSRTVFQTLNNEAKIIIGNNVGISHSILCSRNQIIIEDDVFLGSGVRILDNDFHPINYNDRLKNNNIKIKSKPIIIKKGAFIGAGSIILKGVVIGEKSIVGAGSVVTKNVPENEIWAGNPAKFVKKVEDAYEK